MVDATHKRPKTRRTSDPKRATQATPRPYHCHRCATKYAKYHNSPRAKRTCHTALACVLLDKSLSSGPEVAQSLLTSLPHISVVFRTVQGTFPPFYHPSSPQPPPKTNKKQPTSSFGALAPPPIWPPPASCSAV